MIDKLIDKAVNLCMLFLMLWGVGALGFITYIMLRDMTCHV